MTIITVMLIAATVATGMTGGAAVVTSSGSEVKESPIAFLAWIETVYDVTLSRPSMMASVSSVFWVIIRVSFTVGQY